MEFTSYVYALVDPRDGQAFYIGKGKGKRCHHHVRDTKRGRISNARKTRRIAEIMRAGVAVEVRMLAENLSDFQAVRVERALIRQHRDSLTNRVFGHRHEMEACFDRLNEMIARFRTPRQWIEATVHDLKRTPTQAERCAYRQSWKWHVRMRAQIIDLIAQSAPQWAEFKLMQQQITHW